MVISYWCNKTNKQRPMFVEILITFGGAAESSTIYWFQMKIYLLMLYQRLTYGLCTNRRPPFDKTSSELYLVTSTWDKSARWMLRHLISDKVNPTTHVDFDNAPHFRPISQAIVKMPSHRHSIQLANYWIEYSSDLFVNKFLFNKHYLRFDEMLILPQDQELPLLWYSIQAPDWTNICPVVLYESIDENENDIYSGDTF